MRFKGPATRTTRRFRAEASSLGLRSPPTSPSPAPDPQADDRDGPENETSGVGSEGPHRCFDPMPTCLDSDRKETGRHPSLDGGHTVDGHRPASEVGHAEHDIDRSSSLDDGTQRRARSVLFDDAGSRRIAPSPIDHDMLEWSGSNGECHEVAGARKSSGRSGQLRYHLGTNRAVRSFEPRLDASHPNHGSTSRHHW